MTRRSTKSDLERRVRELEDDVAALREWVGVFCGNPWIRNVLPRLPQLRDPKTEKKSAIIDALGRR